MSWSYVRSSAKYNSYCFADNNIHGQVRPVVERRPSKSGRVYSPQPFSAVRPSVSQAVRLTPYDQLISGQNVQQARVTNVPQHFVMSTAVGQRAATSQVTSQSVPYVVQNAFQSLSISSPEPVLVSSSAATQTSEHTATSALSVAATTSSSPTSTQVAASAVVQQQQQQQQLQQHQQLTSNFSPAVEPRCEVKSQLMSNQKPSSTVNNAVVSVNNAVHRSQSFNVSVDPVLRRYQGKIAAHQRIKPPRFTLAQFCTITHMVC